MPSTILFSLILSLFVNGPVSDPGEYRLIGEWLTSCDPLDIAQGCNTDKLRPFVYPTGISVDSSDNVYLADLWSDSIQVFTSDGKFLTEWGSRGNEDGRFLLPTGIALDSSNNVYVVDLARRDIQVFTSDGKFITKWGSRGSSDGMFNNPIDLGIDSKDNVFVVDQLNKRVQKFTSDGKFVTKWGEFGTSAGQFLNPKGIAIDSNDNIFVVDQNNNNVQKFTNDGKFITKWGSKCLVSGGGQHISTQICDHPENGEFYYPDGGIAIDSSDNIFVVDQNNNNVQKFTNDGKFITKWTLPDYNIGVSSTSLFGHSDIEADSTDRILTTVQNDKILIYSYFSRQLS